MRTIWSRGAPDWYQRCLEMLGSYEKESTRRSLADWLQEFPL